MNEHTRYRYALNTSTIRSCGLDVPQMVEVAAQAGYQGMELWVSEIEAYQDGGGTLADLRRLLDRHGLEVPNLIAFFHWTHPDDEARRVALEEARRVLGMARDLDCPFVAAPPAGIADRDDISLEHVAMSYKDLLELGRHVGTRPLLEFWGHSKVLCSLDDAIEVLATWRMSPMLPYWRTCSTWPRAAAGLSLCANSTGPSSGLFTSTIIPTLRMSRSSRTRSVSTPVTALPHTT